MPTHHIDALHDSIYSALATHLTYSHGYQPLTHTLDSLIDLHREYHQDDDATGTLIYTAMIHVEVKKGEVVKVRILPQADKPHDWIDLSCEPGDLHERITHDTWAPLENLPSDVVWEG